MHQATITEYIIGQLRTGLSTADITSQLRAVGWTDDDIQEAFAAAQASIAPVFEQSSTEKVETSPTATTEPSSAQLPSPAGHGRLKTGWLLFRQSLAIIQTNPALWRYMLYSVGMTLLIALSSVLVYVIDNSTIQILSHGASGSVDITIAGFLVIFLITLLTTIVTFYYATALSSHVLNIFRGEQTHYKTHMAIARRKLPAIVVFALISVVVGFVLRKLEQNFKIIGWIIAKILGVLWTLGTTFVLPIIADTDKPALTAIKDSITLFKKTWGETFTSRVALTGLIVLIYLLVMVPVTFGLILLLGTITGSVAIAIVVAFGIFGLGLLGMAVVTTLTTNVLNAALYYYAVHGSVPPSFSPELLASAFVQKKKHRQA